jgi:perosamine synthetase
MATGSMVSMTGGKPVFCDVSKESFLLDLEDAEKKVTEKTKAISPVHLFGNPCDIDAVTSFARKHNLYIVWDAAQAHGARYKGEDVGSFGDFTCYSFYPSKNMFVGEGGMTCTNSEEFAVKLKFLRTHGQTGKYLHTMLGLNYRMTDVEASIGREQLKRLDEMLSIRRRNAQIFDEGLRNVDGIFPQEATPGSEHACHQYCVVVDSELFGCDRDSLAEKLADRGIATGVHYPRGMHQQPVFEELYGKVNLEQTEYLTRNILAWPVHHGLSEDEAKYIVKMVQEIRG